jgi:hypothetical protein
MEERPRITARCERLKTLAYSNALLIASGSPYHKQQYQQHTQTTKIPWENQDRVIRVK